MCTSGTTVPVGTDYQKKWGAGIALNLNQQTDRPDKFPISELPKAIKGFSFTLSGETIPAELRVNFPTAATATAAHYKSIRAAGDYVALFSEAQQPSWVSDGEKVALVPSNVVSIEFQVVGNPAEAVPFSFCVARLSALY